MTTQFVFFPFTHLTQNQIDTLISFFPVFQYFPASADFKHDSRLHKLFEQGKVAPFFSSPGELAEIELKVRQYLEWARIHHTRKVDLKLLLKDVPYFTDDSDVTAIKSRIRGVEKAPVPENSSRQNDLLFLKMAHLCDEQNEKIDLELKALDTSQDKLISGLRGIESTSGEKQVRKPVDTADSGAIMTGERIHAWSGCMRVTGGIKGLENPLFITTSEAVFDYLESNCKDVVNALDIDKIKVHENECENKNKWQHQFCEYLTAAVQAGGNRGNRLPGVNDRCSLSGQIKVNLFSGNDMNQLFNCSNRQVAVCLIKLE